MPRVHHVKRARYDNSAVKKGEEYWWWRHKTGPASGLTVRSASPPRRSQLTQSSFYQTLWELAEGIDETDPESSLSTVTDGLNELKDELQSSFDNLPEALQEADGGTGELLRNRIESIESAISDLDGLETPHEEYSENYEEDLATFYQSIRDAIESAEG